MTHPRPLRAAPGDGGTPERMHLLLSVATAVNRSLDPQEIAEAALWLALETVNLRVGLVALLKEQEPMILASHGFPLEWLRQFQATARRLEGTVIDHALQTGVPAVFSDLRLAAADALIELFQQASLQSLVCLPLQSPADEIGVMLIGSREGRTFGIQEVDILQAIGGQISAGLRNAWLFTQSQRQVEELESVTQVASAVVSSLDSSQILTRIMEEVTARLDSEAAALLLLDMAGGDEELEFVAVAGPRSANLKGIRLKVGQGVVGWVAQHGQPLLVPDVSRDERFYKDLDKRTATVTRSVLCVPMRVRERLIGVVEVINKRHGQFSIGDQRLLESLAAFAAVAIENARLYEEASQRAEQALLYARDLTTAYRQERQQREALDRLRYNFLNVIGHELKSPLAVILPGLEVLKDPRRGSLAPDQMRIVDALDQQARHLLQTINGLVNFATFYARQGTLQLKPVSPESVLDDALALSQFKAARKNIRLEERRRPPLPVLPLDSQRVAEAIAHLIDNAIKFSPEGSTVMVEAQGGDHGLEIRVIDRGCGIAANQVDAIWDSFSQLNTTPKRGLEGLGLGLAIARYVVEAHGGTISVESTPGKGSIFTIRLPAQTRADPGDQDIGVAHLTLAPGGYYAEPGSEVAQAALAVAGRGNGVIRGKVKDKG